MEEKMKKYMKMALVALFAMSVYSCSGFLEEYSQDLARVEEWEDMDELLLGSCYLHSSRYTSDVYDDGYDMHYNFEILHFMTDEIIQNTTSEESDNLQFRDKMYAFYTWQQDTGVDEDGDYIGGDETYWNKCYSYINVANAVIADVDEIPELDEEDKLGKERVKGEAYFLRAAYYFLLVNLYAQPYVPETASSTPGVPVKLTSYVEDKEFVREPLSEVYQQILSDLEHAEELLEGKTRRSVYHANKIAAYLLHSRVYLYMQDWKNAAKYAQYVLDAKPELLNLGTVEPGAPSLSKDSPETIFSMGGYLVAYAFADYTSSWTGSIYTPAFYLSDDMVSLFKEDDLRATRYVGESYYGKTPNAFTKVDGQATGRGSYQEVSDCFLFRTPEAYLTLAEASAFNDEENTARAILKTFLSTRMEGVADVTETGNELIDLIRNERAREFLLEGHRWFDLRRYTVCKPYPWSKTIEHGHAYYSNYDLDHVDVYRLEANDAAYTLPIPREVRNFQPSIGNNSRPARKPIRTE